MTTHCVLGSGVALGVYIPALLIEKQLNEKGLQTKMFVIENLFSQHKQDKILENKRAYHNDFRVALMGQKIKGNYFSSFDSSLITHLYNSWKKENQIVFYVFSGFWMHLIEQFKKNHPNLVRKVYCCHMDAITSTSWENLRLNDKHVHNIWAFNANNDEVTHFINIGKLPVLPFDERDERLIIHGGGWGMGTYKQYIPEIEKTSYIMDIITYEKNDIGDFHRKNYYMIDPSWKPWEKDLTGKFIFPPFGKVDSSNLKNQTYNTNNSFQLVYLLIRKSKAIVSKPGGATLFDSLASCTPLIFLEPFGKYEAKNGELWEKLGLGISFKKWRDAGYNQLILKTLHDNLVKLRNNTTDIMDAFQL